ncbi:two-component sensor histidine kinase [Zoogloea oryzae]|uniref:histidine kinase n=1 Tax=Zoogloea oryzae TaxID=310767 RepID=A0ABQ6F9M4_9RHOO|nr:hybrid sensor histidine kinase/response regulator [Zoogloea oryzae]GLT21275.1 two-component sensor histidine kinase [Zoogloea oryzae]
MPLANRIERRRLFLPIIALMVLPILLVWGAVVYKAQTEEEMVIKAVYTENLNLARAFEEHTIRTIKSVDQAVLFLKFQYERYGDKVNIAEYVREGMIISNIFNQLGVIDENGIYILSNLPNHKQMDLSDREHFRVHKEKDTNQLFISKPILGRASGKWSIQMTRRINKPDGSFGGVVVISVDPFYFSDFYRGVDLGPGGVVSLVGLDGITRARRAGDNMTVGQDLSQSALIRQIREKPVGSLRTTSVSDGFNRLYSYRALTEYPLIVAVGVTEDNALSEFRSRRFGYQVFAFATTLIVLLFGGIAMRLLDRQYRITAQFRESQIKAESANRMKSEFLASMSHELRTPLNGIMGYAELLRESTTGENQEFAGVILDSSEHLLDLVNSILDLAKIESGKMELVMRPEPLRTLIDKIVRTYQPPAAKKGLELAVTLADDLPANFVCDATRVVQVLNNLISNAIKFTDHGRVEVRVSRVGDELEFVVADSGCGIAPDMLSHVFERFSQADNFLTRRHQGTGLGLALVKELVDLMGGSVNVRSELEKGSEFIVRLPLDA